MIVSYPKSGRTWLLCLLSQLLTNSTEQQGRSDVRVRSYHIKYSHGDFIFDQMRHPYRAKATQIVPSRGEHYYRAKACLPPRIWRKNASIGDMSRAAAYGPKVPPCR